MGSSNGTDFGNFTGPTYHVNGATAGNDRPHSVVIAFPGGTVGKMATGQVLSYTLPASRIKFTPVLIDSFGGDGNKVITVTGSQVITGNGVTYNRQSKDSIIGAISSYLGDEYVYNLGWSSRFYQLLPGQYSFTNSYITWHYDQYIGYYMLFEF
jgi:hypothetical protein